MNRHDVLPPNLASAVRHPWLDDDDELPPVVGERYRDTVHDIHRAQIEAQQEAETHEHR